MSLATLHQTRRQLTNWNAATADLRKARRSGPATLITNGTYDLAAIMREANRCARRYPSLPSRNRRLAVAPHHVWSRAKAQRLAAVN